MTPESAIKKAIIQYLKTLPNCEVFPIATSGVFDVRRKCFRRSTNRIGTPDILCCLESRFIAIEVKSKVGKLRPEQIEVIDAINKVGGLAFVARSVQDVILALANL